MRSSVRCVAGVLLLSSALAATAAMAQQGAPPPAAAPAAVPPGEVHGGPVDEYLQRAVRYGFSGAALVAKDGKVILARGYGLAERGFGGQSGIPNTASTRFDIGSISKQFTAAAILRLQMQGKLSIDDPVSKFFDETVVLQIPEESRRITLHQLMTHTSGLHGGADLRNVDLYDRDAVVAACLSARTMFAPGASFGYANTNYFVLAAVVERVSGMPFEEAMRELVFAPAGMADTTFCGDESADDVACGHEDVPGQDGETLGDIGPANLRPFTWGHRGATGVLTTVLDLHRWHEALKADAVLSAEAKKVFFTPVRQQYACGWQVARDENDDRLMMIHHGGTTVGFEACFARWAEDGAEKGRPGADRGVVILLMNSRRGLGNRLQSVMAKFALARPDAVLPELPPKPVEVDLAALERMAGTYRLPSGGAIELSVQEGKLIASPAGQDASALLNLPTPHLAPVLARASGRAQQALKGWLTGDERDMAAYTASIHDAVPKDAADRWTQKWSAASRPENPLTAVEVLGSFVGEEGLQTAVRLRYQDADEVVRIFWRQDQVYGIGPYDVMEGIRTDPAIDSGDPAALGASDGPSGPPGRIRGLAVHLLPESPSSFASMDPEKWTVLRITAQPAEGAAVQSILIRTEGQAAEAKREQ